MTRKLRGRPELPESERAVSTSVRLYASDRARLQLLAAALGLTEAAVIRQALEALEVRTRRRARAQTRSDDDG